MTHAALYLRQSLDRSGDGQAVARQEEACRRLAEQRGWTVSDEHVYVDNDVSASSKKPRPEYQRMLADAEDGEFQVVVAWAVDRLTRKIADLEDLIQRCERTGLRIATVSGDIDLSTDAGRLVGRILGAVARCEVERKGARQVLAARQKAEAGNGVERSFGYAKDGGVIEDEAVLVKSMYERLVAGDTITGLARWMSTTGAVTVTGRATWQRMTVRRLLLNPRNAGIATYYGEEVGEGKWTPIVDVETLRAAQRILGDPQRRTNCIGSARKWLGTGLYVCAICEAKVRTTGATVECVYFCPSSHTYRSRERTDEVVVETITTRLRQPDVAQLLARDQADRAGQLRHEAGVLRQRLDAIADDYADGMLDGRQAHRASEKVRAQLAVIDAELAKIGKSNGLGHVLAAPDPAAAFLAAPLGVRRSVIDTLAVVRLDRGTPGGPFEVETVRVEWR